MIDTLEVVPDSTCLAYISYDFLEKRLYLEFNSGHIYTYYRVPKNTVMELIRAKSQGQFFNTYVRRKFPFMREY